ncbi:MAG: hypothetical protein ACRDSN_03125, partial [Pseudonocardiaceae bacterium]
ALPGGEDGFQSARSANHGGPSGTAGRAEAGTEARFAYLAAQKSNRCVLQASEIMRRSDGGAFATAPERFASGDGQD